MNFKINYELKAVFSLHNETSVVVNETIIAFLCMITITVMFQFCSLDFSNTTADSASGDGQSPFRDLSKKLLHRYSSLFCKNVEGGGGVVIYSDVKYVLYV